MKRIPNLEEAIYRMRYGQGVDKDIPLEKKTHNQHILAMLLKIEGEIIKKAKEKGYFVQDSDKSSS